MLQSPLSTSRVQRALTHVLCDLCHHGQVHSKVVVHHTGDGDDEQSEVRWYCKQCTIDLQVHDEELYTASNTPEDIAQHTRDIEAIFVQLMNGKSINSPISTFEELEAHVHGLQQPAGVDQTTGQPWSPVNLEFNYVELRSMVAEENIRACMHERNVTKNRYQNVVVYDSTRVQLQPVNGDPTTDYINASYVAGSLSKSERRYIACQGPLPHTVDDFWRMVWETNTCVLVMVAQEVEGDRVKCETYWPTASDGGGGATPGTKVLSNGIELCLLDESASPDVVRRTIEVRRAVTPPGGDGGDGGDEPEKRVVFQFQYVSWPDFGVPEHASSFLSLVREVDQPAVNYTNGPVLVHCSAGIGRTGTFLVVHSTLEAYARSHRERLPFSFNVTALLLRLRTFRPGLVQTPEQLMYAYTAIVQGVRDYVAEHGAPRSIAKFTVRPLPPPREYLSGSASPRGGKSVSLTTPPPPPPVTESDYPFCRYPQTREQAETMNREWARKYGKRQKAEKGGLARSRSENYDRRGARRRRSALSSDDDSASDSIEALKRRELESSRRRAAFVAKSAKK